MYLFNLVKLKIKVSGMAGTTVFHHIFCHAYNLSLRKSKTSLMSIHSFN